MTFWFGAYSTMGWTKVKLSENENPIRQKRKPSAEWCSRLGTSHEQVIPQYNVGENRATNRARDSRAVGPANGCAIAESWLYEREYVGTVQG